MKNIIKNMIQFILVCQIPLILFDFFWGGKNIDSTYTIIIFLTAIIYFFTRDAKSKRVN